MPPLLRTEHKNPAGRTTKACPVVSPSRPRTDARPRRVRAAERLRAQLAEGAARSHRTLPPEASHTHLTPDTDPSFSTFSLRRSARRPRVALDAFDDAPSLAAGGGAATMSRRGVGGGGGGGGGGDGGRPPLGPRGPGLV